MEEDEEEKTVIDTTKVFIISMGLGKGGTFRRDINKDSSTEGVINTCTFFGLGTFVLTAEARSETELY